MTSNSHYDRWSISLGQWGQLTVRLHMCFLLFALFTLFLSSRHGLLWVGGLSLFVLTGGVLVHELGHALMIRRLGGHCHRIELWPFGGVAASALWPTPRAGLAAAVAGPMANLLVCMTCASLLWLAAPDPFWQLLHPLYPGDLTQGSVEIVTLKLALWINWMLCVINLIPSYPFDGGRAVYHLLAIWWPDLTDRQRRQIMGQTARLFAIGLLLLAWLASGADSTSLVPTWFALSLLAIFVFFAAKQHAQEPGEVAGTDMSPAAFTEYSELDEHESPDELDMKGPLSRWIDERREASRRRQEQIEAEEERRVDEILARLHETGIESLTPDDRRLLERVSARYRNRHANH